MRFLIVALLTAASIAMAAETEVPPKPEGVDLDVTVIERTPRYPSYAVGYEERSTHAFIRESQKDVKKRWPATGETVTLTGKIHNKGTEPSPPAQYVWLVDGKKVKSGLKGNLIFNVFRERAGRAKGGKKKAARRRFLQGTLPAIPFEVVERKLYRF